MSGSGLIYVVILGMWAAYLVPKLMRRHDEIAATADARSSTGMRVLQRREPPQASDGCEPQEQATPSATRAARARVLARRRRVLLMLGVLSLLAVVVAAAGLVPVVVPVLSTVAAGLYVAHLRRQACEAAVVERRRRRRAGSPEASSAAPPVAATSEPVQAPPDGAVADVAPERVKGQPEGALWSPLPVTLPTYVTKPKAARPARVIDLSAPGPWATSRPAELPPRGSVAPRPAAGRAGGTESARDVTERPRAVNE